MSYDIDITKTPPAHEPERQYYYMEKAKDFVEKKSKEIGRPMTYFVYTHKESRLPPQPALILCKGTRERVHS